MLYIYNVSEGLGLPSGCQDVSLWRPLGTTLGHSCKSVAPGVALHCIYGGFWCPGGCPRVSGRQGDSPLWRAGNIHLPSAFPPPCPCRLLHHRWPAGLGDNSVLCLEVCSPKTSKNKTECRLVLHFLFFALRHVWCRKITKI